MTTQSKALLWASTIISAALLSVGLGFSDAASYGIVSGLSGAAFGHLYTGTNCLRGCLS
ncbi:hypothetical protein [Erythrobacter insulae]|uniref:hypothetical protein n=1 Tax=Erythrobacter insulae TaxID=2584124 RepID=UPI00163DA2DF|nr:hypothetical protein [Erythrobacter insulae]